MSKCANCGKERGMGMFTLISDLCDECYEKLNYYTPDFQYPSPKRMKESRFYRPGDGGNYSFIEVLMMFSNFEKQISDEIKTEARQEGKLMARVFKEYKVDEKLEEFIRTGEVSLQVTYFFFNNKLNSVANSEDRNKDGFIIIVD